MNPPNPINFMKSTNPIHSYSQQKSQSQVFDETSKIPQTNYYEKAFQKMQKQSREKSEAESLHIDSEYQKYITYNDMQEQLGWLTEKWRKQALLKIATIALISLTLAVTFGKHHRRFLFCFFLYSAFKFINQTYMHIRKIKAWLIISEFFSTLIFVNQLFVAITSFIDPYSVLTSHSIYLDYSLLPALNCTILYFFLARVSKQLVIYPQFSFLNADISKYVKQLIENIPQTLWTLKLLIVKILVFLFITTYALNILFLQINSKTIIYDILRPTTIFTNLIIIALLIIADHLLLLTISKPVEISENNQKKFLETSIRNKVPHILQLLRMNPDSHPNIQKGLINLAQQKSLEEMLLNRNEIGMKARKYITSKSTLRDFMELEISCSRFYKKNSDIFKEFIAYFLQKRLKKTMAIYKQITDAIFSLQKINRASLVIDLFFPVKVFYHQIQKYFIVLQFLEEARTLTYILDILIEIAHSEPKSNINLACSLIDTKKYFNKIYQFLDQIVEKEPFLTTKNQAVALKNKIQQIVRLFDQKESYEDNLNKLQMMI